MECREVMCGGGIPGRKVHRRVKNAGTPVVSYTGSACPNGYSHFCLLPPRDARPDRLLKEAVPRTCARTPIRTSHAARAAPRDSRPDRPHRVHRQRAGQAARRPVYGRGTRPRWSARAGTSSPRHRIRSRVRSGSARRAGASAGAVRAKDRLGHSPRGLLRHLGRAQFLVRSDQRPGHAPAHRRVAGVRSWPVFVCQHHARPQALRKSRRANR